MPTSQNREMGHPELWRRLVGGGHDWGGVPEGADEDDLALVVAVDDVDA